jgi:hypothetical protein
MKSSPQRSLTEIHAEPMGQLIYGHNLLWRFLVSGEGRVWFTWSSGK